MDTLRSILEWCKQHQHDPPTVEVEDGSSEDISQWDVDFFQGIEPEGLAVLVGAANLLDIKGLMTVLLKIFANLIKGKTPEEVRGLFKIRNDFTPAEEEQIRKENEFVQK